MLAWSLALLLLASMAVQLGRGMLADSATSDEPVHIFSGYITLTQHHALFDPKHPFPVKVLTALPLLFLHPRLPAAATHLAPTQAGTYFNTYPEASAWANQLLFSLGNNARLVLDLPRAVIILLTLLCAFTLFCWTRALFGPASGLLALTLIAFDPSFLANGHLANDDTAAALAYLLALVAFARYLRAPSYRSLGLAGLTLGIAFVTKYSLLILGPTDILLLVLWLRHQRHAPLTPSIFRRLHRRWQRYAVGLLGIFVIAWLVIWFSYGTLILLNPTLNPVFPSSVGVPAADLLAHVFPAQYSKGLAELLPTSSHVRDGYLLGVCFAGNRLDYFPVLALFKIPIPILILAAVGLVLLWRQRNDLGFTPVLLTVPILLYLTAAAYSGIDIGFRHVLPIYALVMMIAAYPVSRLPWRRAIATPRRLLPAVGLAALGLWLIVGTLRAAPNFLPYFNALAGEPRPVPYVASDSNVDWGQATQDLATYVKAHHIARLAFATTFGYATADALHLPYIPADPANHAYTGYLAIARSAIVTDRCTDGSRWAWVVDTQRPIAIVAGAINLYDLAPR